MQTTFTSEQLTYGIQLWKLNCLYWDGHNYRWARHHRSVEPAQRGKIAVTVNRALKRRFASTFELHEAAHSEGNLITMPVPAVTDLRALLPRGATVSTFPVVESRTGLSSRLLVFAVVQGEIVSITHAVATALRLETHAGQVIIASERGQAGAALVGGLARALYGDALALHHHSLEGGH
jgi:hypothetical protein